MQLLPGVVAKGGAEGVLVLATAAGHAVAVKVLDGNPRATTAIGLTALAALGYDVSPAEEHLSVPVLGGGQVVGEVRVCQLSIQPEVLSETSDAAGGPAPVRPG
jgi:L-asparaginase II